MLAIDCVNSAEIVYEHVVLRIAHVGEPRANGAMRNTTVATETDEVRWWSVPRVVPRLV